MWLFEKMTTIVNSGILKGMTDWHSHLLPEVDDGSNVMGETLQILAKMEMYGVKEVWLTPHIMEDIPNETEVLKRKYKELKDVYTGNIQLNLAAEYLMDTLFEERLNTNDLLSFGEERNLILVETSYFGSPYNFDETLDAIGEKAYHPVLAHPERYMYMKESDYRLLKARGVFFQLNLFSLIGAYGKEARRKAEWLLEHRMYDLLGTDTHRLIQYERCVFEKLPIARIEGIFELKQKH